jgi:hypothetical protein
VYIAEAHAMNEWPLKSGRFNHGRGSIVVEEQPKQGTERCRLARRFASDFGIDTTGSNYEVLVDDPETGEPFEKVYAPWPLRFYIVKGRTIEWIAEPESCSFELAIVEMRRLLNLK